MTDRINADARWNEFCFGQTEAPEIFSDRLQQRYYCIPEDSRIYPFYIGNVAANVATDVVILIVPIPLVWRLHMRTSVKIMVTYIFILGGFYFSSFLHPRPDIDCVQS